MLPDIQPPAPATSTPVAVPVARSLNSCCGLRQADGAALIDPGSRRVRFQ